MLILLHNFPFRFTTMMYMKFLKCKLKMINKLSLSAFSMKNLATKGRERQFFGKRENNLWENKSMNKKNQWAQTKCIFPNVPFAKHTLFYMKMQFFIFSFFNFMNAEKKLGALNQQFKWFLLSRNEEYKQQFLFWRKNEDFNNNFSINEMKILWQFPISKANDS